jgi:hypothetical protein
MTAKKTRFATIRPAVQHQGIVNARTIRAALRSVELDPLQTDHGIVERANGRGIGIIVHEYGLFVPPPQQTYFAINKRLYAGNAILYAFNSAGETINIERPLPLMIHWLRNALEVEQAITLGIVLRPQQRINNQVTWSWPQEVPKEFA